MEKMHKGELEKVGCVFLVAVVVKRSVLTGCRDFGLRTAV